MALLCHTAASPPRRHSRFNHDNFYSKLPLQKEIGMNNFYHIYTCHLGLANPTSTLYIIYNCISTISAWKCVSLLPAVSQVKHFCPANEPFVPVNMILPGI